MILILIITRLTIEDRNTAKSCLKTLETLPTSKMIGIGIQSTDDYSLVALSLSLYYVQ